MDKRGRFTNKTKLKTPIFKHEYPSHHYRASSIFIATILLNAKDRERNVLSIELGTFEMFSQKLEYIHYNAVILAGLFNLPKEYKYSRGFVRQA